MNIDIIQHSQFCCHAAVLRRSIGSTQESPCFNLTQARDWERRPHSVLGKDDTMSDQVETILHLYNSLLPTDLLPNTAMIAEHFGGASSKPDQKPVID